MLWNSLRQYWPTTILTYNTKEGFSCLVLGFLLDLKWKFPTWVYSALSKRLTMSFKNYCMKLMCNFLLSSCPCQIFEAWLQVSLNKQVGFLILILNFVHSEQNVLKVWQILYKLHIIYIHAHVHTHVCVLYHFRHFYVFNGKVNHFEFWCHS